MNKHNFALIGALVGFFGTFVATLGLIFRPVEIIADIFLAPGRIILSPLQDNFANTNGFINILFFAVINAIVFGLIFWLAGKVGKSKSTSTPS